MSTKEKPPYNIWLVRVASIACILEVEQPNGLVWHAIHMRLDGGNPVVQWSKMDVRDPRQTEPFPGEVLALVSRHFLKMFTMPVESRQDLIDKCKTAGPTTVIPGVGWMYQPCCLAEKRGMNGGCVNCGAPCL